MGLVPGASLASNYVCGCSWGLSCALVLKPGLANLSLLPVAGGSPYPCPVVSLAAGPPTMPCSSPLMGAAVAVERKATELGGGGTVRKTPRVPFPPCNMCLGLTLQCLKCNIYTVFSKSAQGWHTQSHWEHSGTFRRQNKDVPLSSL